MDMRAFVAKYGLYGEYGGPDHSGEQRNADGSIYIDPGTRKPIPYYYDPIDLLDYAFKLHDLAYDAAKLNGNQPQDIMLADLQLIINMWTLPSDPDNPDLQYPGFVGQQYREQATILFLGKLINDGLEYDAALLNNLMSQINAAGILNLVHSQFINTNAILCPEDALAAFQQASSIAPPRRDPLILDLDGDGIETVASTNGAYFDHDGNGFAERTGWAGSDDGLLVLDRNSDGIINNGTELFGDQTILQNGQTASNGFQALAEFDVNSDGRIDANDAVYTQLKIWQDLDGDGYSQADEMKSLPDLGINAINMAHTVTNIPDGQGNTQVQAGTFEKADSTAGQIGGFMLQRDTAYTIAEEWLDVPEAIALLPELQGYGNVLKVPFDTMRHLRYGWRTIVSNSNPISFLSSCSTGQSCFRQ